jgi:hypothetical protein
MTNVVYGTPRSRSMNPAVNNYVEEGKMNILIDIVQTVKKAPQPAVGSRAQSRRLATALHWPVGTQIQRVWTRVDNLRHRTYYYLVLVRTKNTK